ncbi:MAG: CoA pyrophosphatase [Candidatus Bathyarchaeia archaeon]
MDQQTVTEKLSKTLTQNPQDWADARAAVVAVLRLVGQDVQVLLVKRAEKVGDPWSGQIALPGGKRDSQDRDLKQTAVREAMEETGINILEDTCFLGAMQQVKTTEKPDMTILPFVVLQQKEQKINLNEELAGYFWVSLQDLKTCTGTFSYKTTKCPAFILENYAVWGITHTIVNNLLVRLTN